MTSAPKFETLLDIFNSSTERFARRDLFGTKKGGVWSWSTYADFKRDVDKLRGGLADKGVKAGDRVAIIANNRPEWAISAYACYGLGAALVPMYEAQLEKDWEFIIRDCEAKALIVANDAILEKVKGLLQSVPSLKLIVNIGNANGQSYGEGVATFKSLLESGKEQPAVTAKGTDTACFIYTSGTTGNPKGVILSHFNIASNVVGATHERFPIGEGDCSLSFLPWAHSFGQTAELHAMFSVGGAIAIAESVDKILENLVEVRPTVIFTVPRVFNRLYGAVQKQITSKPGVIQRVVQVALKARAKQRAGTPLGMGEGLVVALTDRLVFSKVRARFGGRLKYAFCGGAALSREVAEFIDSIGVTVYEGYGLTETSPISTSNCPGHRKIGTVGRAIPGVKVFIDPGDGKFTTKEGVEGEVIVSGDNVMQGYHNRKEENDAVFTKTPSGDVAFRTGDLGKLDKDGYLSLTGRIKEQYKLENGKYVVPTPLEEQLKLSPLIANVMVYGDNKPYNIALVVVNGDALEDWARENGEGGSIEALLKSERVKKRYAQEIEQYSGHFKGFEGVKDFALISEDFTQENGMLTPSLKVKRREVIKKWGSVIDALYVKKKTAEAAATAAS